MVRRDFAARYVGSVFGASWSVLNPLAFILIYTLVFSRIMQAPAARTGGTGAYSYGVFLCAGLLPWMLFVETLTRSLTVFLEHRGLLKHQSFPRSALFVVVLLSSAIQFAITFGIFLLFLLVSGEWPGWTIVGLLPLLVLQQAIAVGLGVALGTLNVYFRDTAPGDERRGAVLVLADAHRVPGRRPSARRRSVLTLNPLYGLVEGYRTLIFARAWPPRRSCWPRRPLAAVTCLLLGRFAYRRLGRGIVDEL